MADISDTNNSSLSTTWGWRRVKISRAPQASVESGRRPPQIRSRSRRNPRDPLTISISYRGGAECWWEIHARGCIIRRPGHNSLHDVLWELQGDQP